MIRLLIVTGMSGAGKTIALKAFEDMGYYCIDNLPVSLVPKFAELILDGSQEINKAAVGIDTRSLDLDELKDITNTLFEMKNADFSFLFLDANDETLLKRFKETRRMHPLSRQGRIEEGISLERKELFWVKSQSRVIIDTSHLLTRELKSQLYEIYEKNENYGNLQVTVLSFGFKYGIPEDSDLLFDVRFLPNPYYVQELKLHTGLEDCIQSYVRKDGSCDQFLSKLSDMLEFLIPKYIEEGKNQLLIAIGCTGGKHRSVTVSELLYKKLSAEKGFGLIIKHRDIKR